MAGKRPRHIQRTTSMSQLGSPGSLYQGFNGDVGLPIRGRSCPPKQELGHISMEPCPEAVKAAGLLPSDMEEHVSSMVIDSSGGESISFSCSPWSGADRPTFDRGVMLNGEAYTCFSMYQCPSDHLRGKASETLYRRTGRFDSDRSRPANFLDMCYLCSKLLGHGRDVYIYRGDRAFCSAECRQLQMLADERREKSALTGASDGPVSAVQGSDASNASHVETVVAA